jgi:hypothetical protein
LEDYEDRALTEVLAELATPAPEPPAGDTEPVTEPIVEPAAEGDTGDEPLIEDAAPVEPVVEQTIPYDRFKEVNDKAKYWEEQARLSQELLQRAQPITVEPEPEPEEDYSITQDEWDLMDDASRKVYLRSQVLQERLDTVTKQLEAIAPVVQQSKQQAEAEAQAQAEYQSTVNDIAELNGALSPDELKALNDKTVELAVEANKAGKPFQTVKSAVVAAYKAIKTPVVPPKPVVNPQATRAKEAVAAPGGVHVPSGAKPVVEGTMSMDDAIQMALNEIPKPR